MARYERNIQNLKVELVALELEAGKLYFGLLGCDFNSLQYAIISAMLDKFQYGIKLIKDELHGRI